MPRRPGHDGKTVALLTRLENAKAHLVRLSLDLELVQLRTSQASRRAPELLNPASETLAEVLERVGNYQHEIDAAIRLLATPEP